ncbi:MAG: hypothetical protein FWH18_02555 [Marinilabiliaceae bacterium]|nr:hypothetical protein [Marinilabiliaceae bacterium]
MDIEAKLKTIDRCNVYDFVNICTIRTLPILGANGNFNYWTSPKWRQTYLMSIFYALIYDYGASQVTNETRRKQAYDSCIDAMFSAGRGAEYYVMMSLMPRMQEKNLMDAAVKTALLTKSAFEKIGIGKETINSVLLQDIDDMSKSQKLNIDTKIYGNIWQNFHLALKKEGCIYWWNLYEKIFNGRYSRFQIAHIRETLDNIISSYFPEIGSTAGLEASAVANYLERNNIF